MKKQQQKNGSGLWIWIVLALVVVWFLKRASGIPATVSAGSGSAPAVTDPSLARLRRPVGGGAENPWIASWERGNQIFARQLAHIRTWLAPAQYAGTVYDIDPFFAIAQPMRDVDTGLRLRVPVGATISLEELRARARNWTG